MAEIPFNLPASAMILIAGILLLGIGVAALVLFAPPRYVPQTGLFSQAELKFLQVLEGSVGADYRIYAKVRMADIITPKGKTETQRWWKAFTKISSKHVDYLLVERATGQIRAAIELDDKSHDKAKRRDRDHFVNRAFAQAGVPLIRVPVQREYRDSEIRKWVSRYAQRSTTAP